MSQAQATALTAPRSILAQQRASWDHFSPGWGVWDGFTMGFLKAQGLAIVEALAPAGDARVLDVATGTGEPGLSLAARAIHGTVAGVDISTGMLAIAEDKARGLGRDNFSTVVADACELPFEDDSFDCVACRLGFMFFPEPAKAAAEMARVLRPGGRLATTVWSGPPSNPWVTVLMRAIAQHFEVPPPPPGAPGMFRCAAPGAIGELFERSSLRVTREEELVGAMECRSPDEYFRFMNDVVPPVVAVLKDAPEATIAAIRRDVVEALASKGRGGTTLLEWGARLVVAEK